MIRRLLLLPALLLPLAVQAQFDWQAKYAGDYLQGQSNARLLALGGAGTALAEGPEALLANPARLNARSPHAISLMHADRFGSLVRVDHGSYLRPAGEGRSIAFGFVRQGVDDIPVTRLTNPGSPIGPDNRVITSEQTSAAEYAFVGGYALDSRYGRIGATAKLLYKQLHESSGYGLGFDLGWARSFGSLSVGAQLRDVVASLLAWETGRTETIGTTARFGAAWELPWERMKSVIVPVAEVQLRAESLGDDDMAALHAGLEYRVRELVAARIGYDDGRIAYGGGVSIGPADVDYAFIAHDDLGPTHRVSLGLRWGS